MPETLTENTVPRLRRELIIRGAGDQFVVKDADRGTYFYMGEQEHFLLTQFDGQRSRGELCTEFERRFHDPLPDSDLQELVELAKRRGFLHDDADARPDVGEAPSQVRPGAPKLDNQRLLHYRVPFFDPDWLLGVLAPPLRFIWTRAFLATSLVLIATAVVVGIASRQAWVSSFPGAITWEMVILVWVLIAAVTMLHEFAHGLTCKHFGGEVHEIGFLLLFFMPCLYCNVSDAWLMRERWKRLWIGFAGTYLDLMLWAAALLVWRVTLPETNVHYIAWMLTTVCGGRLFFNLNPLIKLDGYYLLSDWTETPNLADRSRRRLMKTLRWLLWGGSRPRPMPGGGFLLAYGLASWLFIGALLVGLIWGFFKLQDTLGQVGYLGVALAVLMTATIGKNQLRGVSDGEFSMMFFKRRRRALAWAFVLIGVPMLLAFTPIRDRASGSFLVRPSVHVELSAQEAGFLRDIAVEEGSVVYPGAPIARIEIPDLESRLAGKAAQIRECEAKLRQLKAGTRPEELAEQRLTVERSVRWQELGERDLERAKQAFREETLRLSGQIAQYEAELEFCRRIVENAEALRSQNAISDEGLLKEKTACTVKALELEQAQAQSRALHAAGTTEAEAELTRRQRELARERSKLKLMEAGSRPEEIEVERARLARLTEEQKYLKAVESRVLLCSPVAGVVITPRMSEMNGKYVPTGTVVCVVEQLSDVMAEIAVKEENALGVKPGQVVELRARAMPFHTFKARVERVAPSAVTAGAETHVAAAPGAPVPRVASSGQSQAMVTVYCRLIVDDAELLSGMTGYARIYRGETTIGALALRKTMKHLHTEFWWW